MAIKLTNLTDKERYRYLAEQFAIQKRAAGVAVDLAKKIQFTNNWRSFYEEITAPNADQETR